MKRYLLRPGAGSYSVGTVVKINSLRGKRQFACAFVVNGQHCQTGKLCGTVEGKAVPCPAFYSRRYVHFAPESPDTAVITDIAVPDSVRTIPPLGWPRIPQAGRLRQLQATPAGPNYGNICVLTTQPAFMA